MNNIIQSDFAEFVNNEEYFNTTVKIFRSKGGELLYDGKCIYDEMPQRQESEDGGLIYTGQTSILSIAMSDIVDFMPNYFSLKGYYVEVTDNNKTKNYFIENSVYNSNVNCVYCDYLKEDK